MRASEFSINLPGLAGQSKIWLLICDSTCYYSCFRILIATDNHVGYNERDPIRGQDSMNTFREILEIAKERKVSMRSYRLLARA